MTDPRTLYLPELIGKQTEWADSDALIKVLRVGRRGSKTRFAFVSALAGHGPGWAENAPLHRGVLQGLDVVWLAQTYTNLSTVLWKEEIVPRMGHLPYVDLNTTKHDVTIRGLGSLMLRSADREAIDSIRGIGSKLGGVIIDEAAHLDLRGALLDVILPACIDNGAWIILMSTTNAAGDGGYDDTGAPQIPSYFNVICEEIRAGKRGPQWKEFYATAYDNPEMNTDAIDALVKEYPPESPKLKQEVFAELLRSGVGLALPRLSADRHLCPRFPVPPHWPQFGSFDWGFNHPWVFGWYCADTDGNVYKIDTLIGRGQVPHEIANTILGAVPATRFNTFAGPDIWQDKGKASGFKGPTIAEQLSQHGVHLVEAKNDRVLGLDNLRRYTFYEDSWDVAGPNAKHPRFRFMDTDGNKLALAQMQAMQIDPKNMEDALKIDADSAGRGGDDMYDETRYGLMSRPIIAVTPRVEREQGRTAGYDYTRMRPAEKLTAEDDIRKLLEQGTDVPVGRYHIPQRQGR